MEEKERFLQYVKIGLDDDACWIWTGATRSNGYGSFGLSSGVVEGAHRASYILFTGSIPEGLWVLHKCDVKNCVNPKHLFLGTQSDNMQDSVKKGRTDYVGRNPNAKLSWEKVREIRASDKTFKDLARIYKVTPRNIALIMRNESWVEEEKQMN